MSSSGICGLSPRREGTDCHTSFALLEESEQGKEEEPEDAHGMPVPGGGVDEDLACLQLA